jgi:glycosyltransferase involved in cell wall biosynthesis
MFKISAVVATYNRERFLPAALQGLKNQTLNPQYFEIIIVNNNSTDRTKDIALQFINENPQLNCKYVEEYNQGLSFGRNRGIVESNAKFVTFIDDDAVIEEHFLENAVKHLEKDTTTAAVGGKIFAQYLNKKPKWMSKYIQPLVGHVDYGDKSFVYPLGKYPYGSNMTIVKQDLMEAGMFNTSLGRIGSGGLGGEEKDLFDKLMAAGKKIVYYPDLIVYHSVDDTRLTKPYIKRLSLGVGGSEMIRMRQKGFYSVLKKWIEYLFKLGASVILAIYFLIKGQAGKAYYLLYVRWYATIGFLFPQKASGK